jgi:hypothetical protein
MNIAIENSDGESFTDYPGDCPTEILTAIHQAQARGRTAGLIYGQGKRWSWQERVAEVTTVEVTREGEVVLSCAIPTTGWAAFRLVAHRAGFEPSEYLATVISGLMVDENIGVREAIAWLFPSGSQSAECHAFEQHQATFHHGECHAQPFTTHHRTE